MGQSTIKKSKHAYAIAEWAEACSVAEAEVKAAIGERALIARRTPAGQLVVLAKDGRTWLKKLPKF